MESRLEESQRWRAKAHSSLTAAKKLLEESLFAEAQQWSQRVLEMSGLLAEV